MQKKVSMVRVSAVLSRLQILTTTSLYISVSDTKKGKLQNIIYVIQLDVTLDLRVLMEIALKILKFVVKH